MINEKLEEEYDYRMQNWQISFARLCQYEKNLVGSARRNIGDEYMLLLEKEERLRKKLNEIRKKIFVF